MKHQKHVLIAEDNADVAELLEYRLRLRNFDVARVTNGTDVVPAIRQYRPDAIILDIMLPELDGVQVCHLLKQSPQTKEIPVVVVTALRDEITRQLAMSAGADFFVGKQGFLKAVDHALDQCFGIAAITGSSQVRNIPVTKEVHPSI